ncbi:MAG: T9SS type A sorting domain-containing protein, partial [Flavobacteriales bacterium]|nr:T9SS type A sorting domain-containing protein [Flavobacteriales bacterium]
DNCQLQGVTISQTVFGCADLGTSEVFVTSTDIYGNADVDTVTVDVKDINAPDVITVDTFHITLGTNGLFTITPEALVTSATDNCTDVDSINFFFNTTQPGLFTGTADCGMVGTVQQARINYRDLSNNQAQSGTVYIVVKDITAPVVNATNSQVTKTLDASGNATISLADFSYTIDEACGPLLESLSKMSFTCADLGPNNVTYTVEDANGNATTHNFTVNIVDNIAPTVNLVSPTLQVTLDASGNAAITVADVENGSTDNTNCGTLTKSIDISNFDCADVGTPVTVTVTVEDPSGNASTGTVVVTVVDNMNPIAGVVPSITLNLDANGNATLSPAMVENGSIDNCSITSSTLTKTTFSCVDAVNSPITVGYFVTDASGNNSTTKAITVTVKDVTAPVLVTKNKVVYLPSFNNPSVTVQVNDLVDSKSDACGISSTKIADNNSASMSFDCAGVGTHVLTVEVKDASGNMTQETAVVEVMDTVKPIIVGLATTPIITYDCVADTGFVYPVPTFADVKENCAIDRIDQIAGLPSGAQFPIGTTVCTYVAVDVNGNKSAPYSRTITVLETTEMPDLTGVQTTFCEGDADMDLSSNVTGAITFTGNGVNNNVFSPANAGTYSLNYTWIASTGCPVEGTITITVNAKPVAPVITQIASNKLEIADNGFSSVKWYLGSTLIQSGTSTLLYIDQSGNYKVMVENNNGCANGSATFTVGGNASDFEANNNKVVEMDVQVYPNPSATGLITLDYGLSIGATSIEVYDARGIKVKAFDFNSYDENSIELDLSELSSAMYHLVITRGKEVVRKKIVINR